MPMYRYVAHDEEGKKKKGSKHANNLGDLDQKLLSAELYLVSYEELSTNSSSHDEKESIFKSNRGEVFQNKVKEGANEKPSQNWSERDKNIYEFRRKRTSIQKKGQDIWGHIGGLLLLVAVCFFFLTIKDPFSQVSEKTRKHTPPPSKKVSAERSLSMDKAQPLSRQETSTTAEEVFATVAPSVVVIKNQHDAQRQKQGSGVVVTPELVITNRHVVDQPGAIKVYYQGRSYLAQRAYQDPEYDLSALYVPRLPAPAVEIATYKELRSGQRVYTLGAPRGLELTIAEGLVSALRPNGDFPWIQTTAPISPGSSGGGLFNTDGRLVGITTASLRDMQQTNIAIVADLISLLPERHQDKQLSKRIPTPQTAAAVKNGYWNRMIGQATKEAQAAKSDYESCVADRDVKISYTKRELKKIKSYLDYYEKKRDHKNRNKWVDPYNRQIREVNSYGGYCKKIYAKYQEINKERNELIIHYNSKI